MKKLKSHPLSIPKNSKPKLINVKEFVILAAQVKESFKKQQEYLEQEQRQNSVFN